MSFKGERLHISSCTRSINPEISDTDPALPWQHRAIESVILPHTFLSVADGVRWVCSFSPLFDVANWISARVSGANYRINGNVALGSTVKTPETGGKGTTAGIRSSCEAKREKRENKKRRKKEKKKEKRINERERGKGRKKGGKRMEEKRKRKEGKIE